MGWLYDLLDFRLRNRWSGAGPIYPHNSRRSSGGVSGLLPIFRGLYDGLVVAALDE
jgi:hypothetical protein